MKIERHLGAMVSYLLCKKDSPIKCFKWDAGFFNGRDHTNTNGDYDSYKDFVIMVGLKQVPFKKELFVSVAVSYFNVGFAEPTASCRRGIYTNENFFSVRSTSLVISARN